MALPPGLILNPATGELTGVPTQAGTFEVNLTVRDTLGSRKRVTDSITIAAYTVMDMEITLGAAMDTRPLTGASTVRTGGQAPYVYSILSGTLPAGLAFDPDTGEISGTPIGSGDYAFTARVTDQLLQTKDTLVSGAILENLVLTAPVDDGLATVGVAKPAMVPAVAGGAEPFEFELVAGTLPAGMVFSEVDGSITGTPTAHGVFSGLVIEVTGSNGFTAQTAPFALDVKRFPTMGSALVRGTVGEPYGGAYVANFGHAPHVFGASGLPPGLTLNTETGEITGTPTTAGTYAPVVTLTDAKGNVVTRSNTVPVAAALNLTGTVPAATRDVAYSFRPSTSGGWPGYSYAITAGALPAGLSLNATTGLISGTPTTQSENSATLTVTDADGATATLAVNISVAGDLALTGSLDARATTTVAYADNLGNTGGTAPFAWSISVGALPPGITMNTTTGAFSGTPTTPGTYNFTVRVRDANASYAQTAFSIVVAAFPSLSGTLVDGSIGWPYSHKGVISGGHAPLVYTVDSGALPTGLSLNASNGIISGTPSVLGEFEFVLKVTDDAGNADFHGQLIEIFAAPSLSGDYETQSENTVAYSDSISVSGGKAPIQWSIGGGTVPNGLTLNGSTGAITGFPDDHAGTYGFTVKVADALGRTATSSQSITVRDVLHFGGNRYQSLATQSIAYDAGGYSSASGGWGPYFYDIAAGSLPPGVSISSANGTLFGTPTTVGAWDFTARVTDGLGKSSLADSDRITVRAPVVLSGTAPKATRGVAYSFTPNRTGGWGPFAYSITAGGLPTGLSLDTSTGRISGTPPTGLPGGTATVVIRCIDNGTGGGSVDTHSLSIVVATYPTLVYPAAHGTVGRAFSVSPTRTGGHSPFSYALVDGSFPPGISINKTTGVVSGTPTTAGSRASRVRLTDAMGNTIDEVSTYTIAAPVSINTVFASPDTEGTTYSSTISASGGWTPRTFSRISGTLPPGLSLSSSGTLSGTSTTPGTYGFTIRCTDADGNIDDRAMSVTINAAVADLVVTASPNPASSHVSTFRLPVTASASSTASTTGGTGAKTFSWVRISGDSLGTASGTSTATMTLKLTSSTDAHTVETWRVTARDAASDVDTYDVTFNLSVDRDDDTEPV